MSNLREVAQAQEALNQYFEGGDSITLYELRYIRGFIERLISDTANNPLVDPCQRLSVAGIKDKTRACIACKVKYDNDQKPNFKDVSDIDKLDELVKAILTRFGISCYRHKDELINTFLDNIEIKYARP